MPSYAVEVEQQLERPQALSHLELPHAHLSSRSTDCRTWNNTWLRIPSVGWFGRQNLTGPSQQNDRSWHRRCIEVVSTILVLQLFEGTGSS